MSTVAFLHDQVRTAWGWLETTVSDVTDEQANWWPQGTANSIGATYLHVTINADVELNRLLHGHVPLIEGGWQGDVGQETAYSPDHFDDWTRATNVRWERLHRYGAAVQAWLVGSLDDLTDADLEQPVDVSWAARGTRSRGDLYALLGVHHVYMHGGEVACLKGLQWAKGYLGGVDAV